MPQFVIDGIDCLLDVPQLGVIPITELKEIATSLVDHQLAISSAIDRLFGGY